MEENLNDYNAVLKEWVKREDIEGKPISELSPEQMNYWQSLVETPVEDEWEPILTMDDLAQGTFSVIQLNGLINARLVSEEEEDGQTEAPDVSGATPDPRP